jgi:hypothetical protein
VMSKSVGEAVCGSSRQCVGDGEGSALPGGRSSYGEERCWGVEPGTPSGPR